MDYDNLLDLTAECLLPCVCRAVGCRCECIKWCARKSFFLFPHFFIIKRLFFGFCFLSSKPNKFHAENVLAVYIRISLSSTLLCDISKQFLENGKPTSDDEKPSECQFEIILLLYYRDDFPRLYLPRFMEQTNMAVLWFLTCMSLAPIQLDSAASTFFVLAHRACSYVLALVLTFSLLDILFHFGEMLSSLYDAT